MDLAVLINLPDEALFNVALSFDLKDIVAACASNSVLNARLCDNDNFWQTRYLQDFGPARDPTKSWEENYRNFSELYIWGSDQGIKLQAYNLGPGFTSVAVNPKFIYAIKHGQLLIIHYKFENRTTTLTYEDPGYSGINFIQISSGGDDYEASQSIALDNQGRVYTDLNRDKQLEEVEYFRRNNIPVREVQCYNATFVAVDTNNMLYVWGRNVRHYDDNPLLGIGDPQEWVLEPVPIPFFSERDLVIKKISVRNEVHILANSQLYEISPFYEHIPGSDALAMIAENVDDMAYDWIIKNDILIMDDTPIRVQTRRILTDSICQSVSGKIFSDDLSINIRSGIILPDPDDLRWAPAPVPQNVTVLSSADNDLIFATIVRPAKTKSVDVFAGKKAIIYQDQLNPGNQIAQPQYMPRAPVTVTGISLSDNAELGTTPPPPITDYTVVLSDANGQNFIGSFDQDRVFHLQGDTENRYYVDFFV